MMAFLSRTGHQPLSPPPFAGVFLNDVRGERVLLRITRRSSGLGPRPDSSQVRLFSSCGVSLSVRPACLIEHFWQLLPTASSHHAQCFLGVKAEVVFGQRPYVGTVVSWESFPEF